MIRTASTSCGVLLDGGVFGTKTPGGRSVSTFSPRWKHERDAVYFYSLLRNTQTGTRGHESLTEVRTVEVCPPRPRVPQDAAAENQAFIGTKLNL